MTDRERAAAALSAWVGDSLGLIAYLLSEVARLQGIQREGPVADERQRVLDMTLDDFITGLNRSGAVCGLVSGCTTPESWPFVVMVAIGRHGEEYALAALEEAEAKIRGAAAHATVVTSLPRDVQ